MSKTINQLTWLQLIIEVFRWIVGKPPKEKCYFGVPTVYPRDHKGPVPDGPLPLREVTGREYFDHCINCILDPLLEPFEEQICQLIKWLIRKGWLTDSDPDPDSEQELELN